MQKFSAFNFFWVILFAFFLTDSNSTSNFALYDVHIDFLHKKNLI